MPMNIVDFSLLIIFLISYSSNLMSTSDRLQGNLYQCIFMSLRSKDSKSKSSLGCFFVCLIVVWFSLVSFLFVCFAF